MMKVIKRTVKNVRGHFREPIDYILFVMVLSSILLLYVFDKFIPGLILGMSTISLGIYAYDMGGKRRAVRESGKREVKGGSS